MNVQTIHPLICCHNTDNIPAEKDTQILYEIHKAAAFFNSTGL